MAVKRYVIQRKDGKYNARNEKWTRDLQRAWIYGKLPDLYADERVLPVSVTIRALKRGGKR